MLPGAGRAARRGAALRESVARVALLQLLRANRVAVFGKSSCVIRRKFLEVCNQAQIADGEVGFVIFFIEIPQNY